MKRQQQSALRRFFASRSFLLIALFLAVSLALGFARAYYQDYKVRQEIGKLEEEVKHLETKKLESMEILKYVVSESYVEDKARTELNMKKPGENVVFIENLGQDSLTGLGQNDYNDTDVDETLLNNPRKWWYYFRYQSIPDKDKN